MAKVLKSFLIGVGLDTEKYDKGADKVEGSLGRMRTLVGFTGAAMVGAFTAAGVAAIGAGKRVDDFVLAAEKLKTPTAYVHNYGRALAALGGNAEDALRAIEGIEKAQSDLALKGMLGPLEDVALARGDINALAQTKDGAEFLRTLAGMVPGMDKDQQRLVQDTLGLSDAVMRSLRGGVAEFDAAVARAGELYGAFGRAADEAREFQKALAEINTQLGGIGETLAETMLPAFTGILQSTSDFISDNRSQIDRLLDRAAENPTATGIATGGAAAAATGAGLRMVGLRTAGLTATRFGVPGMAIGSGLLAADAAKDWEWGDWWYQSKMGARDSWRDLTGQNDFSHLPDAPYGAEVPIVAPGSIESLPPAHGNFLPLNEINYHDGYKPEPIVESPTSGFVTPYESIYGGGEVSNAEAASASPEVIMVQGQRSQNEKPVTPQRVSVQNHLDVKMELDGRALDSRVTDVIERRERNAAEDLVSTVDR